MGSRGRAAGTASCTRWRHSVEVDCHSWRSEAAELPPAACTEVQRRLGLTQQCSPPHTPARCMLPLLSRALTVCDAALQVPIWNLWLDGTPYSMDYGSGSNAYAILKVGSFTWLSGLGSLRLVSAHGLRLRQSMHTPPSR